MLSFNFQGFCPKIRDVLNGQTVHVTPSVGKAAVEFHCYTNFRLIGRPRLECIHGRWNGKVPFCESKYFSNRMSPHFSYSRR